MPFTSLYSKDGAVTLLTKLTQAILDSEPNPSASKFSQAGMKLASAAGTNYQVLDSPFHFTGELKLTDININHYL